MLLLAPFSPFVSGSKERLAAVDNIWLWRADHDSAGPVRDGKHPSKHGLIVRGDNGEPNAFLRPTMAVEAIKTRRWNAVTSYGLAVEHVK